LKQLANNIVVMSLSVKQLLLDGIFNARKDKSRTNYSQNYVYVKQKYVYID